MKRFCLILSIVLSTGLLASAQYQDESYQARYDRLVNTLQAVQASLPASIEGLELSSINPNPKSFVSMMVVVKDRQTFEALTRDVNALKGQILAYAGNTYGDYRMILEQTVLANLGVRITFSNQVYDDFKMVSISSGELKEALGSISSSNTVTAQPMSSDVLAYAEKMPEFTAAKDFTAWANARVRYPANARSKKIQGRVSVRFVVDENGNVRDAVIERGLDPDIDAEALRVVRSSPKWKPGEQNGKKAAVYYTVPISFRLQ